MGIENANWLTSVVSAHPNHEVVGRTRLQKTICLLQRLGMPTDYEFSLHFFGPYSEDLKADVGFCEQLGLLQERAACALDGSEYFIVSTRQSEWQPGFEPFTRYVNLFSQMNPTVLELAATYDAFREMGLSHEDAIQRLRAKKGDKCAEGREQSALQLLQSVGLAAN